MPSSPRTKTIAGQPSWVVRSDTVELAITKLGGHMAPVTFGRNTSKPIQPYYISPWQGEDRQLDTPVLVPLRGDFFCMPFGGDNAYRGEDHPAHGETATAEWTRLDADRDEEVTRLELAMETRIRPGRATKLLQLVDGHDAVYVQHRLEGYSGKMCLGHHATLAVPAEPGSLRLTTSAFRFGMTNPELFGNPADGEYPSLAIGRRFRKLEKVPLDSADGGQADCTRFPARPGYTDLLGVFHKPSQGRPAWTAAAVPSQGYLWYSLKHADVLPSLVIWISNRGRHGEPWLGRNRCLGLEDVCAHFADGLKASARKNRLSEEGIDTTVTLSPRTPTVINYIEGAVRIPKSFDRVKSLTFGPEGVTFTADSGKEVAAAVHHPFIFTGRLD